MKWKNVKSETSFCFFPLSLHGIKYIPLLLHTVTNSTIHWVTHCVCLVIVMLCFRHWTGYLAISHAE